MLVPRMIPGVCFCYKFVFGVITVLNSFTFLPCRWTDNDQNQSYVNTSLSLIKNAKVPNDAKLNQCRHLIRKSCSKCGKKTLKRNCENCAADSVFRETSGTQLPDESEGEDGEENSLALVPIQRLDISSNSIKIQDSQCFKPGWSLLRHTFLPKRQCMEKTEKKTSVFGWALRPLSWNTSAVVYPDHKLVNSAQDEDCSSMLNGISGAIVPFGPNAVCPPLSPHHGMEPLPEEFLDLCKKYSSSCRLFCYKELLLATSNFRPGLFLSLILQSWFWVDSKLDVILTILKLHFSENMVGKGGSSSVYRGCLSDGKELAVKLLKPSGDILNEFVHEIEILTTLNHKNIISLFGFCFDENNLLLVYNFISRGSLEENLYGIYFFGLENFTLFFLSLFSVFLTHKG